MEPGEGVRQISRDPTRPGAARRARSGEQRSGVNELGEHGLHSSSSSASLRSSLIGTAGSSRTNSRNSVMNTPIEPASKLQSQAVGTRSDERRVGEECVSPCRLRWTWYNKKKKLIAGKLRQ